MREEFMFRFLNAMPGEETYHSKWKEQLRKCWPQPCDFESHHCQLYLPNHWRLDQYKHATNWSDIDRIRGAKRQRGRYTPAAGYGDGKGGGKDDGTDDGKGGKDCGKDDGKGGKDYGKDDGKGGKGGRKDDGKDGCADGHKYREKSGKRPRSHR